MSGNHNSGRKRKYLTLDEYNEVLPKWFMVFMTNDFKHLKRDVKLHRTLLWIILATVIVLPTAFMIAVVQLLGN